MVTVEGSAGAGINHHHAFRHASVPRRLLDRPDIAFDRAEPIFCRDTRPDSGRGHAGNFRRRAALAGELFA